MEYEKEEFYSDNLKKEAVPVAPKAFSLPGVAG
jgi:hypothetical protein